MEDEIGGACRPNMHGDHRNVCKILVGKLEGKKSLGIDGV
jgi:hypothetical protein